MTIWLEAPYAERFVQASILVTAAAVLVLGKPQVPGKVMVVLAVVALWGPLQLAAAWSVYRYDTETAALRWITLAATFFLARESLHSRGTLHRARAALAGFGAVLAVLSIVQAYTSQGRYFWLFSSGQTQVFGPFQNINNYAAFIELMLPLVLWEGLRREGSRALWAAVSGVMAASVIASGSRAGSVLVAAEMPAVFAAYYLHRQILRRPT